METKSPGSADLELHLGYWLRRVSNHVSGAFARGLQTRQTSVAEWVVLCRVDERPGITPGELAEAFDMTRGAISKVIDKLEMKRWVRRTSSPKDSRLQLLSLTPAGRRVLPQLVGIADRNDREFFSALDAGERAALRRLMIKLAEFHQIKVVPVE